MPGTWQSKKMEDGSLHSQSENRYFIASNYALESPEEFVEFSVYIEDTYSKMPNDQPLELVTGFADVRPKPHLNFRLASFKNTSSDGFFIIAYIGTNAGPILVTYEGLDDVFIGREELDKILASLSAR
ncbi:hypothetical protein QWZ13_14060 [Reinekea marina]|nr:hypothetical protein [Reinekea marina]MDN3650040.1 hypothetical protein [Reinekea marina]